MICQVVRITKRLIFLATSLSELHLEILGHDRLATTEIYLNFSPEDVIREFHSKW
jgi:hypothetical protein